MELFFSINDEYKKNSELKKEDVKALQDWAKKQGHLPEISEWQLILFLQSCYFRLEPAKSAIENYFTIRTHLHEVFKNRNLKTVLKVLDNILIAFLPTTTKEGYQIIYTRYLDTDPEKYEYIPSLQLFEMAFNTKNACEGTKEGYVMICDAHGQSLAHMLKMNFTIEKKFNMYFQDAIPIRLKGIHIIHASPIIDKMMTLFKPFLSQEILQLIHIHSDMKTFYKHLPQDILPTDLGGKNGSFQELREQTRALLTGNEAFFAKEEKQVVDESKRIGKSKILSEFGDMGMDGSFKKLSFD